MMQQMLAIWSLVSLPFVKPSWTSGSSWFTYCWSLAWRILSITLLACEMSAIVWYFEHSLALPFLGIGMKTDLFQSHGHCWVFQICWHFRGWKRKTVEWRVAIPQISVLLREEWDEHDSVISIRLSQDLTSPGPYIRFFGSFACLDWGGSPSLDLAFISYSLQSYSITSR